MFELLQYLKLWEERQWWKYTGTSYLQIWKNEHIDTKKNIVSMEKNVIFTYKVRVSYMPLYY